MNEQLLKQMVDELGLSNDLKIIDLCLKNKSQADFLNGLVIDEKRKKWIEDTITYLRNPLTPFPVYNNS